MSDLESAEFSFTSTFAAYSYLCHNLHIYENKFIL